MISCSVCESRFVSLEELEAHGRISHGSQPKRIFNEAGDPVRPRGTKSRKRVGFWAALLLLQFLLIAGGVIYFTSTQGGTTRGSIGSQVGGVDNEAVPSFSIPSDAVPAPDVSEVANPTETANPPSSPPPSVASENPVSDRDAFLALAPSAGVPFQQAVDNDPEQVVALGKLMCTDLRAGSETVESLERRTLDVIPDATPEEVRSFIGVAVGSFCQEQISKLPN